MCFACAIDPCSGSAVWCERGDSNPHGLPRQLLRLVRLPIPPLSRTRDVRDTCGRSSDAASAERVSIADCAAAAPRDRWPRRGAASDTLSLSLDSVRSRVSVGHYENFPVASRLRAGARCGRRSSRSTASPARPTTSPTRATRRPRSGSRRSPRFDDGARRDRRRRTPAAAAVPRARAAIREHALPHRAVARPPVGVPPGRHRRRATRPTPTSPTTAGARPIRSAGCCSRCIARETPANGTRQRRHLHRPAAHQLLAGRRDRLAQGPRLPAAGRPRPLRRHARRRSPTGAPTTAGARCCAFETARARALLRRGRPLARALPWRLGLELSAVIEGGLRILARIDAVGRRRVRAPAGAARARLVRGGVSLRSRVSSCARRAKSPGGMTPDEYCQQKAAQSGSSFYYSFLFLPPPRRRAITALYAFCREVDDVVDEVHDPAVARTKLAWWRQEVAATFDGTPQHPVAQALASRSCASSRCRAEHFQTVIDGMAMDLEQTRYVDFAALELYCHRVAGVVGLMSAEIFGYADPRDARLRARPRHRVPAHQHLPRRRRGRAPRPHLPAAGRPRALRRHAVRAAARRSTRDAFRDLMAFEVERAQSWYATRAGAAARGGPPRAARRAS